MTRSTRPEVAFNSLVSQTVILLLFISKHSVLIDDRESLREDWEGAGGIFVHHVNTDATLQKLKELGVVEEVPKNHV